MQNLSGGIDIGSENHHVIIMNEEGVVVFDHKVRHTFEEFYAAIKKFKEIEEFSEGRISFAIEGKHGYGAPFDRILLEHGFRLYNIDNLKLKRFRDIFGADWKNDQRDSKMLAKLLKLKDSLDTEDEEAFIEIEKPSIVSEKLKLLSRHQQTLIDEKVSQQNRLEKKLLEICPGILEIGNMDSKKFLRILVKYPDFSEYKNLKLRSLEKIEMIGKTYAGTIHPRLVKIEYVKELSDVYRIIIYSIAKNILDIKEQIDALDKMLDEIGQEVSAVKRITSIPGVGVKLSSRLIGEIDNIDKFKTERQLAVYCGITCVENSSGKVEKAKLSYKSNKICKVTMVAMAGCSIRNIPESGIYYAKKRAEGKSHNHALRCLARQIVKVIFKMLKEDRDYVIKDKIKKAA
ncbi:MAG: IS110 family transposase [Nitrospirae bacterium]|nr:IS110 family transposase [Nitrospirota bacterium]